MLRKLQDEVYSDAQEERRLVDCLPDVDRWGKAVWEALPDSGVEVSCRQRTSGGQGAGITRVRGVCCIGIWGLGAEGWG